MKKNSSKKIVQKIKHLNDPVAIFPIGIAGSGKSYLINSKTFPDFFHFEADIIRKKRINELRAKGIKILVNGEKVLPNPKKSSHVFNENLREWVFKQGLKIIEKNAKLRKNIIVDQTNLHLQRVYYFNLLRKYNYKIIAIVFTPKSLKIHSKNIQKRVSKGGLDIAPDYTHKKTAMRLAILLELKTLMECFLKNLKVGTPKYVPLKLVSTKTLKTKQKSIKKYLQTLNKSDQKLVLKLLDLDRAHFIYKA